MGEKAKHSTLHPVIYEPLSEAVTILIIHKWEQAAE